MEPILDIGSKRELFIDESLLETMEHVALRLHEPQRKEIVLQFDSPEFSRSGFHNIFWDNGLIRLYYRGRTPNEVPSQSDAKCNAPLVLGRAHSGVMTTHYAQSADGIHFELPELGIVEWDGSKNNNIVLTGHDAQNFCVFRDDNPGCREGERYKAVGGDIEPPSITGPKRGLNAYTSPDGIRWSRAQAPMQVLGFFDSLNVPFWDHIAGCYRLFSRFTEFRYASTQDQWPNYCRRDIQNCESSDFIHWSTPVLNVYSPSDYDEQYYTNSTCSCPGAEHILLAFPMRFVENRKKITDSIYEGISDIVFMASRDGKNWRRYREAYVRADLDPRNWVSRANIMATGIIPTSPNEWSIYLAERYCSLGNCLRRLSVRPWGFVSLHADASDGEVITKPFYFTPGALRLNYATSAIGHIKIEVLSANHKPISGFELQKMDTLFGNELDREVTWQNFEQLEKLAGQPIRLKIQLKDADLFSMRFTPR